MSKICGIIKTKMKKCTLCNGSGWIDFPSVWVTFKCSRCFGSGKIKSGRSNKV